MDDVGSVVAAAAHEYGHTSAHLFYNEILYLLLFLTAQRRCLAGGGEDAKEVCAVVQLVVEQPHQGFVIYSAIGLEGSNEGDTQALENIVYHTVLFQNRVQRYK